MVHALGGILQQVLAIAGVSTAVAARVSAVVVAAAVGARTGALSALVFEHSPAGMALADASGRLRTVNPTLARWCASTSSALVGRYLGDLVEPADASALAAVLGGGPTSPASVEVRLLTPGGHGGCAWPSPTSRRRAPPRRWA